MSATTETFQRRFVYFIAPSLLQAALPFLVLPLTTLILSPEHYGVLGLATGITGAAGALASMGVGLVLAQQLPTLDDDSRRVLVTTVTAMILVLSLALTAVLAIAYVLSRDHVNLITTLPPTGVMLVLLDLVATNLWAVATTICTLNRQARPYATVVSLRALATPAAVLIALYGAEIHDSRALFVGQGAGAIVYLVGAALTLRPFLGRRLDKAIVGDLVRVGGWVGLANVAEMGQRLVERWLLAGVGGLALTGLFAHAQTYGNIVMTGIRPAVQAAFPAMLEDAKSTPASFERTRILVHLIAFVMTLAGLDMALVGHDVIGLLTHGKFTPAGPYAALLIAVAMIKLGGRPQQCMLIAHGHSRQVAAVNGTAAATALALLVVLIPPLEVYGAIAALAAHGLLLIGGLTVLAERIKPTPFLDLPALLGAVAVTTTVAAVEATVMPLTLRLTIAGGITLLGGATVAVLLHQGLSKIRAGTIPTPPSAKPTAGPPVA